MRIRRMCVWLPLFLLMCAGAALGSEDAHGRGADNSAHQARKAYKRQQFFWEQRAFPLGFLPSGANVRAIRQREQARRAVEGTRRAASPAPAEASWVELGPRPLQTNTVVGEVSGRVSAIAIDPRNSSVIYLGAATGGIWKSTDGGVTWTPLTDTQPSLAIGALAVIPASPDPASPLIIYAGTGEGNFSVDSYYGIGLLKSTDSGATWTNLPGPFATLTGVNTPAQPSYFATAHISALAVKPTDPNVVLAGAQFPTSAPSGVYRSSDGGMTWVQTLGGDAGVELYFSTYDPNLVFAALGHFGTIAAGVYRSADGGVTWTRLPGLGANVLPKNLNVGRIALAVTTNTSYNTTTMWAGLEDYSSGNLLGLYRSTDGGTNWYKQSAAPNYCGPQCWYDNVIAISPVDPSVVYLGGAASAGLYRTTNGGLTWTAVNASAGGTVHVDHHALKFTADGQKLYDGNDGGIWSTTNPAGPVSWTNLNHTLNTVQFYPGMAVSAADVNLAFAGAQDNGTEKFSGNGSWSNVTCGDGGFTAIDPQNALTVYAACQTISVKKSTDGGATFVAIDGDLLTANDRTQFIAPLKIDEAQPQTLYFGTYRLWQTKNSGATWNAISGDLTGSSDKYVSTIAVAPGDSNTVYIGTSNGRVMRTNNVFGTPPLWSVTGTGLPTRYVSSIAVDAATASTAYAAFSGFTYPPGDTLGHVFQSIDGGASWVDISGDLPNTPVNEIVIDPDVSDTLYAATDVGVFRTVNAGVNWLPLGSGLPNVPVMSLTLHKASRSLMAATHGRGAWLLSVPAATITVTPLQLNFGSITVGTSTASQQATLNNATGVPVSITSVSTSISDYAVNNNCGSVVPAFGICTLDVTFSPSAAGSRDGTLTVITSGGANPFVVTLVGSGIVISAPRLTLSATSLNFGSVFVGNTSAAKRVTLQNAGGVVLSVAPVQATPDAFLAFSECGTSLAPGATCSVNLVFRPATPAAYSGTLSVFSSDPDGVQNVALTGLGQPAADNRHGRSRKPRTPSAPPPMLVIANPQPGVEPTAAPMQSASEQPTTLSLPKTNTATTQPRPKEPGAGSAAVAEKELSARTSVEMVSGEGLLTASSVPAAVVDEPVPPNADTAREKKSAQPKAAKNRGKRLNKLRGTRRSKTTRSFLRDVRVHDVAEKHRVQEQAGGAVGKSAEHRSVREEHD